MNKKISTLAYLKRQAKKLKKARNISHAQALELIAKEYGYSNWKHCHRSLSEQRAHEVESPEKGFQLSFTEWLKKNKNRNSPLGDLATDVLRDKQWPSYNTLEDYRSYLNFKGAVYDAIIALEKAWKSYKTYLQRKKRPNSNKPMVKKSIAKKHDPRKIVYVSNTTPLPFTARTAEKFNPGDPAWISWDGRKAIPVTILEVDDRRYTFKIERPLKKAGDQHFLYLDEVRSTPELACINYVTL